MDDQAGIGDVCIAFDSCTTSTLIQLATCVLGACVVTSDLGRAAVAVSVELPAVCVHVWLQACMHSQGISWIEMVIVNVACCSFELGDVSPQVEDVKAEPGTNPGAADVFLEFDFTWYSCLV